MRPLDHSAIDLELVPQRVVPEASVELDDHEIVFVADPPRLHTLSPSARLAWSCFDGTLSLRDLALELSDELGIALPDMEADLLTLARSLGRVGLLANVRPDEEAMAAQQMTDLTDDSAADPGDG
jgi:hypothetical protein